MKITYGHMEVALRKAVEADLTHGTVKLEKLLKRYAPDLIHLHTALEKIERTERFCFSLNLVLPTGTLHAENTAHALRPSVKGAFAELTAQVIKHQAKVRKDFEWKRKRGTAKAKVRKAQAEA